MPREVFDRSLEHSLCFALRDQEGTLQGFARAVTDRATFAYLTDVFVPTETRGRGAGKFLIDAILAHPELLHLKRWMLATRNAHGLYAQFGFGELPNPSRFMVRNDPDPYPRLAGAVP